MIPAPWSKIPGSTSPRRAAQSLRAGTIRILRESLSVMAGKPLERINMPLTATAGCVRAGFLTGMISTIWAARTRAMQKPAGSVWITMKRTSPKMATFPKHAALPPIPPNGFTFSPTARQKGQMTVPTQSKPSMTGNIILMRTAL